MNHPFPSVNVLRAEAFIDRSLAEQESAANSFRAAATAMLAFFRDQAFPLGSPCHGYDISDIESILKDWAHSPRCPMAMADLAEDMARERFGL